MVALGYERQVRPRLRFGASLPMLDQRVSNNQASPAKPEVVHKGWSLADPSAFLFWAPWETREVHPPDPFLSLHNLQFYFGLSFPLGDERKADAPAIHFAQLGSGSIDPRFGLGYVGRVASRVALFGDASVLIDGGTDTTQFRNGNLYDVRLGGTVAPHRIVAVALTNEVVLRNRNYQTGTRLAESGSRWDFVTGRVTVYPVPAAFVEGSYALPVYRYVNFVQPVTNQIVTVSLGFRR